MKLVRTVTLAMTASLLAGFALAQNPADFPTRPVKLVVPFAAGGPTDVVARILADLLSARWSGKTVLIENRPGAGTVVATAAVVNSPADGHTVLIGTNSLLINPAIDQKLPYDTYKALTGVSMIATQPVALVANLSFAPSTVPELVAYAKAQQKPMNYTSPGPRGVGHFAGEMLKQRAGVEMTHINYNGSAPALTDVMAGRVPIMFDVWHSAKRYVDAGKLKLIAGAGAPRLADAPDVPTLNETYPGFDVIALNAAVVPSGTPTPVVERLSADIKAVVESPEFIGKTKHLGIFPKGNSPAELDTWMRKETARWADIAKAAKIKVD
ncbi:MAG: tripartite tricarboxylate transporter substrate binding protein [Rhizobiales bacterium]|nr:tripartite tricarboxylate transporter substrate binding protein [Hyphomicrobiales bacterium]